LNKKKKLLYAVKADTPNGSNTKNSLISFFYCTFLFFRIYN